MARKAISNGLRFDVLSRDGFTCQYCGKSAPDVELEIDHVVPVARGGGNDKANLIAACDVCNSGKKAKLIQYDKNLPYGDLHELAPRGCEQIIDDLRFTICNQIRTCTEDEYVEFSNWLHLCLSYCDNPEEYRLMSIHSIAVCHMTEMLRDLFVTLNVNLDHELGIDHTILWPLCVVRHVLKSKFRDVNDQFVMARMHKSRLERISAETLIEDAWTSASFCEWLDIAENRIRTALGIPLIGEEEDGTDGPHTIG